MNDKGTPMVTRASDRYQRLLSDYFHSYGHDIEQFQSSINNELVTHVVDSDYRLKKFIDDDLHARQGLNVSIMEDTQIMAGLGLFFVVRREKNTLWGPSFKTVQIYIIMYGLVAPLKYFEP